MHYILNPHPIVTRVATIRSAAKEAFAIKATANLQAFDDAIIEGNSDLLPNTPIEDVDDFLLRHNDTEDPSVGKETWWS